MLPDLSVFGYARSGKDTIAEHLITKYGYVKIAFADPLRATMAAVNPIVDATVLDDGTYVPFRYSDALAKHGYEAAKDLYPEIRRLYQTHGVAIREILDEDAWVNAALLRMSRVPSGTPVVVTDARFENEFTALDREDFQFVRVLRDGQKNRDSHVSETELDKQSPDFTIRNNGENLEELRNRVDDLISALKGQTRSAF
jgi:hypothetical protein